MDIDSYLCPHFKQIKQSYVQKYNLMPGLLQLQKTSLYVTQIKLLIISGLLNNKTTRSEVLSEANL